MALKSERYDHASDVLRITRPGITRTKSFAGTPANSTGARRMLELRHIAKVRT